MSNGFTTPFSSTLLQSGKAYRLIRSNVVEIGVLEKTIIKNFQFQPHHEIARAPNKGLESLSRMLCFAESIKSVTIENL